MDLREQFEKEEGWYPSSVFDKMESRYKNEYIEWLEHRAKSQSDRIRELEGALEDAQEVIMNSLYRGERGTRLATTTDKAVCLDKIERVLRNAKQGE